VILKRINGEALDRGQTLLQQGVVDGELLILDVIDAEVTLTPVVENASSAIVQLLANKRTRVDERTAVLFASLAAGIGVVLGIALLLNAWKLNLARGQDWNIWPAAAAAALTVILLATGTIVWSRRQELAVANSLWLSTLVAAPAAAVMGTPGQPGVWHAVFGFSTVAVLAAVLWRLAPAPRGLLAFVTLTGAAFVGFSLIRAAGVNMTYLWVGAMSLALLVLKVSESLAGRLAGVPMPEFPTVTGKNTFAAAEDMAAEALAAAEQSGTPTMDELRRVSYAANTYLTAVVASTAVFFILGSFKVVTPGQGRWWLATAFVLILAAIAVLGGRAFADRVQAIIVVATGLVMTAGLAITYALASANSWMNLVFAGVLVILGASGLILAATVPKRTFSPLFRKLVEWLEYALIALVPPATVWLLNLYYLARNR
jgi:type VII secretion integral membrane protein EccD